MKNWITFLVVLVIISIPSVYFTIERYEYFEDEITSYGVANNGQYMVFPFGHAQDMEVSDLLNQYFLGDSIGDTIRKISTLIVDIKQNGIKQTDFFRAARAYQNQEESVVWRDAEYFRDYLTIQKGERFLGWKAYIAAIRDVHPPLYFILLNGVCSLNPEIFSRWQAFSINFLCMLGTCYLLYNMIRKHYADRWCGVIAVFVYGLSAGYMSTMYLYRPYALLTFFTVAFFEVHLNLSKKDWEIGKKDRVLIVFITVLGYLTQYYFIFSVFAVFVVSIVYMIKRGFANRVKRYVMTFVWAAGVGLLLWPFSVYHVFFGDRGTEAIGVFRDSTKIEQLVQFIKIISQNVFVGYCWVILLCCTGAFLLIYNAKKRTKILEYKWMACISMIVFFTLAAGVISPYATIRYVVTVFPFIALLGANVFYRSVKILLNKRIRIIVISVILMMGGLMSVWRQPDGFYQIEEQDWQNLTHVRDGTFSCVYLYNHWHEYMSSVPEFMNYEQTLLLQGDQMGILAADELIDQKDKMVVYVSGYDAGKIDEITQVLGYDSYRKIADKNWAMVYLMERQ